MSGVELPSDDAPAPPLLTVLSPRATDEEIAALVVALASLQRPAPPAPRPRSRWADPARAVRPRYSHGPGGWRSSGLPR